MDEQEEQHSQEEHSVDDQTSQPQLSQPTPISKAHPSIEELTAMTEAAPLSEKEPTDAASFSKENPIDAASFSEKDPTDAAPFPNQDPTDAASLSKEDRTAAASLSEEVPTDPASLSEKNPSSGDAVALAEDQLDNEPEPSRTEVELLIQDELQATYKQPSMREPNLEEDQLESEPEPSRTEVELLIQDELETENQQPFMCRPNLEEDQLENEPEPSRTEVELLILPDELETESEQPSKVSLRELLQTANCQRQAHPAQLFHRPAPIHYLFAQTFLILRTYPKPPFLAQKLRFQQINQSLLIYVHVSTASTASQPSTAKSVSSLSSSTSSIRVSDKTIKISTSSPYTSAQPLNSPRSPHPSITAPSIPMQKPRTTPSKSALATPPKPATSGTPTKPRPPNPSTPRLLSRGPSSLKKSHPASNQGSARASNVDLLNGPPNESSPKTSAKSSQAFREMLAKARRSRPRVPSTSISTDPTSIPGLPSVTEPSEALDAWGFQPIEKIIEKAQKSGKLNFSSRMLSKVPAEIYAKLLSHTSIFHPSNRPPSTSDQAPAEVDLKFSFDDEPKTPSGVAWYETVDLVHLNLSLNELTALDDEFGGFEALTSCDLHGNQLTCLPYTFGLLTNLTHLDLSSNQLSQFPVQILSLVNLLELNLSKNKLSRLWAVDWKPTLKKQLATAVKPPPISNVLLPGERSFSSIDQSFDSIDQPSTITDPSFSLEELCDRFPSSPTKSYPGKSNCPIAPGFEIATGSANYQPLPALQKLKLSGNKFTSNTLFGAGSAQLPRNLQEIDLSKNPLGDRLDVSSNLRNLKKLSKLNLCSCGLSNEIFWFNVEGDYDQLESEENDLLGHLTELDLSHNAIDSLEYLESFFDQHCPHQPRLAYEGLPRELVELVPQYGQGAEHVKVLIGNNFLREEARRRRQTKIMAGRSNSKPVEPIEAVPGTAVETTRRSLKNDGLESSPEEIKQEKASGGSSTSKKVATPPNPTRTLLLKYYNQATSSLNLSSLQLTDLSENQEDYNASTLRNMDVELVNVSNNRLPKFPMGIMGCFGSALTVLNLSRNRLTNAPDSSFESHIQSMMGIKLPELVELNMASNFLTGSPQRILELVTEGFESFKLKRLDLSLNSFESLDGLYDFLKRHEIRDKDYDELEGDKDKGRLGLESLLLDGNRIVQIHDLVRLATEILNSIPLPPSSFSAIHSPTTSSSMRVLACGDLREIVQYKFLEEIGLSDNSISQLPPVLGFLPTNRLSVARNLFRFPLRKVYDCVGGDVKILAWLRERC
ncbi:hypothetical protein VP01_1680g3 [Puccinia sorghi]|uniref:Adenylate cyclase n=1 Tax=Puccinia sorghi TaxID=27349 RepID=A0A0L6VG24_9BASI|nr:hypothetical protein VP01_1680g3 [Puccinia sorghi]